MVVPYREQRNVLKLLQEHEDYRQELSKLKFAVSLWALGRGRSRLIGSTAIWANNRMEHFFCVMWTIAQLAASTVVYVDYGTQSLDPGRPQVFGDLSSALLSSTEPFLEVQFLPHQSAGHYELRTLGTHQLLTLLCDQTHLRVTEALVLMGGTGTEFRDCHIEAAVQAGALVAVFGELTLTRGSVKNNAAKGFALYGLMRVFDTVFEGNRDSIFAAQSFGFVLDVQSAVFQGNTSPAGVVLLLGIARLGCTTPTSIRFDGCKFTGNGALMGGSFMTLSVNPDITFPMPQSSEQRSIVILNSTFRGNPGYLVIAFSKFVNVTFSGNEFHTHDYGFLVDLYDSTFTISNSTVATISRFLTSRFIGGLVTLSAMKVYNVVEGPAIVVRNGAPMSAGFVSIADVEVRNVTLTDSGLFSAVLSVINVAIRVSNLRVSEGYTYACACGCYWFSAVQISSPEMHNMTAEQGALLAVLGSVAEVDNAYLRDVTLTRVTLTGVFISTVTFRNTTFFSGSSSNTFSKMLLNMHVAFDSTVYIYNAYYDLQPLCTAPAFYIWSSTLMCINVTFPKLYSRLADVYSASTLIMRNVTVLKGYTSYMMMVAMKGHVQIDLLTILNFDVKLAIFTFLSDSVATINDVYYENSTLSALMIASRSKVTLSNLTLKNIEADTLFWYITSCDMEVNNLRVQDSKFDLMHYTSGTILLKSIALERITVKRRFITLRTSTVEFDGVVIGDLSAVSVTPFCSAHKSSVTFSNSTLRRFRSREQDLMQLSNSSLRLVNSEASDFNVTFISASRSTISVLSSIIRNADLGLCETNALSAGFIEAKDSVVLLKQSLFEGVTGMNGGVISIESQRARSSVKVESCHFEECGAVRDGGTIRAISADVSAIDSSFMLNSADRGGCVYFECSGESQCDCSISSSTFINNTARAGGVLKWTFVKPALTSNYEANNTADYGPFEASIATHMSLLNSNSSVMSGVPGVIVVEPILIAFLDVINQTVATESKCAAELYSNSIIGTTYLLAENGVSNFSSVIVQAVPGTACTVKVFSPTINATFPNSTGASFSFIYSTRKCIPGEVSTPTGCFLCPKNTFSVRPTDPECKECPKYASCPGAFSLILDQGYWRSSIYSDLVFLCPVKEACEGGQNSTCSEGYTDIMCMKCDAGYYAISQVRCAKCESLWLRVLRTFILFGGATTFSVFLIRQTLAAKSAIDSSSSFIIRRILLSFLHFLLILPLIEVDWKPELLHLVSTVEALLSFSLTSVVNECIPAHGEVWKPVFVRALLASALPLLLLLATGAVFLVRRLLRCRKSSLRHYCQSCLVLLYVVHPFVAKSAVSLLVCKEIEPGTYWLAGDVSVKCWESGHLLFLCGLFVPMLVLFIVGIPALISAAVIVVRRRPDRKVIHFFTLGHSPNHQLWECAVLASKSLVMLTVSLLRLSDSVIQIVLTLATLFCLLELHVRNEPFLTPLLNKLEGYSRFLQYLIAGTSFYYQVHLGMHPAILTLMTIATLLIACGFVVLLVVLDVRSMRKKRKVNATDLGVSRSTANPMMASPSLADLPDVNIDLKEAEASGL